MSGVGYRVTGVPQLARALDAVGRECEQSDALGPIARDIARLIAEHAPRKSGRLAGSAQGTVIGRTATATIGRGTIRYAGVQNYGWPARNIIGRHFIERAEDTAEPLAARKLEESISHEITRQGLT